MTMRLDIKWHHCLIGPPGIPLVTIAQRKKKCYFSGSCPRLVLFSLEGSCRIMALNIPEAFLCRYVYASFGHNHRKVFQSHSHWLFQAISIVLPTTVPVLALLCSLWLALTGLRGWTHVQTWLPLCNGCQWMLWHLLQNNWQGLLFGRELIARGHCISWKWQSPCTRMQEHWRDRCSQRYVGFLRTIQGHSSRTGIVLRDLLRPMGATFLGKGTECCRTLIWSSLQSPGRNTVLLIWQ